MPPRGHMSVPFGLCLVILTLIALGCSPSASYIRATVPDNPLQRVAQHAQEGWAVEHVDENTLLLSDAWPIWSVTAIGYGASYATLAYDPASSELNVEYYFRAFPLMTLWMPISLDAEPGFVGVALKPIMNQQIDDILRWSGATIISRRAGVRPDASFPHKGKEPPTSGP